MTESERMLESFERAFRGRTSGAVRVCACGKTFYNPDHSWTWEEGEIEALQKAGATSSNYAIGVIEFEGKEYADHCECWKDRARKLVGFLVSHDEAIAVFLSEEKKRKEAEARRSPTVSI